MSASPEELASWPRIAKDKDQCIACGACISVCPNQALELDPEGKPTLIWEKCEGGKPGHEAECIKACPVGCIWLVNEAPEEVRKTKKWYVIKEKTDAILKAHEMWKQKFGVEAGLYE